jgi:chaperonin GroEL
MKNSFSLFDRLRNQTTETIQKIYGCVKITLGPTGKNGIVATPNSSLKILTNGSLLMKSLDFEPASANILVKLLEQASFKTIQISGDGSTTTLLLACGILQNSFSFLNNGYNSLFLSNGFKKLAFFLNEKILQSAVPINTKNQLNGILTTSLGKKMNPLLVFQLQNCIQKIERDGLVLVEENKSPETEVEVVQGIELEKGFASSYFITDFQKFEVLYENPFLLIASNPINSLNQLSEILDYIQLQKRPLVIVAEEITKEILSALVLNNIQKKFQIVVVKYTSVKFLKNGILEDLALLSHANLFSSISKKKAQNVLFTIEDLGQIERAIIGKEKSTFLVSKFAKILAKRRINELNRDLLTCDSETEKSIFKTRIARLSGNITKIKLGSSNQYEIIELRQKVENIVKNCQASLEEGFLPGGGIFSRSLCSEIENWSYLNLIGEEIFAGQILSKALKKPFELLFENSNVSRFQITQELDLLGYPYGYNLMEKKIVHTIEHGLIDSSKSFRSSLWNAITTVSMLLTSQ